MSGTTQSPLVKRAITVSVQLGKGSFGNGGFDTVTLANLRVVATVQKQGSPGFGQANVRIYGMPLSIMNQLSSLGVPLPMTTGRNNIVTIEAGDAVGGMAVVFKGTTSNAWADFDGMPETYFSIDAISGAFDAMAPIKPTSYPGTADVATVMASLALQMNRQFENNGVQSQLSSPYFAGTAIEQAQSCARQAHIEMHDDGTTLAIWPRMGTRGGAIPLISPASGLFGYPKYTSQGIRLRTLFNPSILFGGQIQVQSSIQPACGIWYVNELTYDLSSELPGGPWFCEIGACRQAGVPAA